MQQCHLGSSISHFLLLISVQEHRELTSQALPVALAHVTGDVLQLPAVFGCGLCQVPLAGMGPGSFLS